MTYPIGYMEGANVAATTILERARRSAGLTQSELARRAHTSRETVSAYEHGRKSPTLATVDRLLAATGQRLDAVPEITYTEHAVPRGRPVWVPDGLPRLPLPWAFATVTLPVYLDWSTPGRLWDLRDRHDRRRVYEITLREGNSQDISTYIDGALLVDLWSELVLPRVVRDLWEPVVKDALRPVLRD